MECFDADSPIRVTYGGAIALWATRSADPDSARELSRPKRETLLRSVWGERKGADEKSVRVYVRRLCEKLGDDAKQPTYIVTELRVGYRMPEPAEA